MTNPQPAIRLIAADMDGTLLNNAGEISPGNARAIHLAQKKGVIFAICSGRFPENAAITARDGGVECPIVANGGASLNALWRFESTPHGTPNCSCCF